MGSSFRAAPTAVDTNYDDSHNDPACGAGWFRYGDNCYRVHEDEAPWRLAKQTCQSADPSADLLWMTTKAEQQFIRSTAMRSAMRSPMRQCHAQSHAQCMRSAMRSAMRSPMRSAMRSPMRSPMRSAMRSSHAQCHAQCQ
ncbi:hypothetical protein BV898_16736 [Hypsibius exemplaris]|uniref:C-type lectin domain-containing protein n=1 Tax=Hypsibius exemplaris TaxID=2072580 RepID=A0A9X6RLE3_HYPEX|nr:hypothetical protein BV898_16736 [Hypsibius exemplaris]